MCWTLSSGVSRVNCVCGEADLVILLSTRQHPPTTLFPAEGCGTQPKIPELSLLQLVWNFHVGDLDCKKMEKWLCKLGIRVRSIISSYREDSSDRVGKGRGMKRSSERSCGLVKALDVFRVIQSLLACCRDSGDVCEK